jgi:hypothetical protein
VTEIPKYMMIDIPRLFSIVYCHDNIKMKSAPVLAGRALKIEFLNVK